MDIVHDELVIPQELAGSHIEGDHGIGIEIGPRPDRAIKIRRRIPDRQIQDTGLGIERERCPEAASPVLQGSRVLPAAAPGWPGLGTR